MGKEYTEKEKQQRRDAVKRYEQRNDRFNIIFPAGTRQRIQDLKLDKSDSAFVRDTILSKLDELERILK